MSRRWLLPSASISQISSVGPVGRTRTRSSCRPVTTQEWLHCRSGAGCRCRLPSSSRARTARIRGCSRRRCLPPSGATRIWSSILPVAGRAAEGGGAEGVELVRALAARIRTIADVPDCFPSGEHLGYRSDPAPLVMRRSLEPSARIRYRSKLPFLARMLRRRSPVPSGNGLTACPGAEEGRCRRGKGESEGWRHCACSTDRSREVST